MEWISINDRFPRLNQNVKIKDSKIETYAKFIKWEDGSYGYYFCCDDIASDLIRDWTHWMPLPESLKDN